MTSIAIPEYPQPSFYETTVVLTEQGVVDSATIDEIIERDSWNFADAERRLLREHFKGKPPRHGRHRLTKAEMEARQSEA